MAKKSKAYNEGYKGYDDWLYPANCPYHSESKEYAEWVEGWYDAEADNDDGEVEDTED